MSDYKIQINLTDAAPVEYEHAVGSVSRQFDVQESQNTKKPGFLTALSSGTIPYKVGVFSTTQFDKFMRTRDQRDNLDNVDPSFNPIAVWKENKHTVDEFDAISELKNWDEYGLYSAVKEHEDTMARRVAEEGAVGAAAQLAVNIASDPLTYAGFGMYSMVSRGISKSVAGAVSATAAAATSEAINQTMDITGTRDASDSAFAIAGAAVVGGALGKAVDVWGSRKAAGKLKSSGKDFYEDSKQYLVDAQTAPARAESLSAAAVVNDPENTLILNPVARAAARMTRYISPKQYAQTSDIPETRDIADLFIGRNLKTIGDEKGIARRASLVDEHDTVLAQSYGKIAADRDAIAAAEISFGQKLDDSAKKQALILAADNTADLSGDGLVQIVARQYREYFGKFSDDIKKLNIRGYRERKDFGAPLLIRPDYVAKDIDGFAARLGIRMERARAGMAQEISAMENQLQRLREIGADQVEIDDMVEELQKARDLADMSPENLSGQAKEIAMAVSVGNINGVNLGQYVNKLIPNRFRERVLNIKDFVDYIEADPTTLKMVYAREVAPFMASQKVFGDKTPKRALEEYSRKIAEKSAITADIQASGKMRAEGEKVVELLSKSWDDLTGESYIKNAAGSAGSAIANMSMAAKNLTAMSRLGAQVMGSLGDLSAILLTHHFKGVKGFSKALTKLATSDSVRSVSKKNAQTVGISLEKALHSMQFERLENDFHMSQAIGAGRTARIAQATQKGSVYSSVLNGSVFYDTIVRRGLMIAQQGILKNDIEDLLAGTLSKNDATDLAFLGIDKSRAALIAGQIKKHGAEVDGVFSFNTEKWDDQIAREAIEKALRRDSRRASLRPQVGDVPHFVHAPIIELFTQFKSWSITATQVYGLSALQRTDAKHMMAIATFVGISSMVEILNQAARGDEIETDPEELIWGGISRSGMIGVLPELGGSWMMNTLFDINSGGARYAEYQTLGGTLAGPMASTTRDLGNASAPIFQAIDPNEDVNFGEAWQKSMINLAPIPIVKPFIRNQLFNEDE